MSPLTKALAGAFVMLASPVVAHAQGVISERNISTPLARAIADAAMECTPNGTGLSVAVVDRNGQVRVWIRGDASRAARPTRRGPSVRRRLNGPSAARPRSPASACLRT